MLSGVGQSDGLVERLLMAGGSADATLLAGIAIVVGIMLWAAGARAVSLAFAAAGGTAGLFAGFTLANNVSVPDAAGIPGPLIAGAGGAALGVVIALVAMRLVVSAAAGVTAAAAAAGIAVLVTPHLPPQTPTPQPTPTPTASLQPVAFSQTGFDQPVDVAESQAVDTPASDTASPLSTQAIADQAEAAWDRVPEEFQGQAALAIIAAGLMGAMLGAIWPARVASATTAFMGAAIWPLGAIQIQAAAGTPLPIEETPTQAWLLAWLVLGVVGLGIQRLVVRKVAES
ncbi:MAG: hypothetical protein NCW75_10800 [Phycisphaera sp.]|nr:MAG: hypothetical protein NCW75_10800 [Phycisphaera sp.]